MTQILAPQSCCDPVTPVNSPESQCSSRTLPFVLATSLKWQTSATAQPSRLSDEFSSRNVPVRHGSCPMRTEMERTDLSNSRQRAAKFEGAIWLVVSVLSRYGRSGCGIWRSVLPIYITRLQEKMNDPDKLFILHPNIWTTLEHCSRCAAKAKMLQTSSSLSFVKWNKNLYTQRRTDDWVLLLVEASVFPVWSSVSFWWGRKQNFSFPLSRSLQPTPSAESREQRPSVWCQTNHSVNERKICANTGYLFSRILSTLNDTFQRILWIFFKP